MRAQIWLDVAKKATTFHFNYTHLWEIITAEKFDYAVGQQWISSHVLFVLQLCTVYLFVIFSIQRFMKYRTAFKLNGPMIIWNIILSSISITGAIKQGQALMSVLEAKGFEDSYCFVGNYPYGSSGYWFFVFTVMKMVELGDTIFIVLRKTPLMFLHWYHHMFTLLYGTFTYFNVPGFHQWACFLNYSVHGFMYSYFLLKSLKIPIPKIVALLLTTIQILQFCFGIYMLGHSAYLIYGRGKMCDITPTVMSWASFMYTTYLLLFVRFFFRSYFGSGEKKRKAL